MSASPIVKTGRAYFYDYTHAYVCRENSTRDDDNGLRVVIILYYISNVLLATERQTRVPPSPRQPGDTTAAAVWRTCGASLSPRVKISTYARACHVFTTLTTHTREEGHVPTNPKALRSTEFRDLTLSPVGHRPKINLIYSCKWYIRV